MQQTANRRPLRREEQRWLRCPALLCVCEHDSVAPAEAAVRHARCGRNVELRTYPIGHFEIYFGEHFERAVGDQLDFLRRHLDPARD